MGYVYIVTNQYNTVFYVGVTKKLPERISQHRDGYGSVFTKKYKLKKLVYYEILESVIAAIKREKQLKAGSRMDKLKLITAMNPSFRDLFEDIL